MIVAYLEQIGVEYVFGIPGGHIASLYESLYRSEQRGGPRAIMNRHETGAAFMAAGYALETGKIGVCFTTAGPGRPISLQELQRHTQHIFLFW